MATSVSAMHPIGGRETGWDQVRASFERVGSMASGGHVELVDQELHVAGDMACELGIERGHATLAGENVTFEQRVTNVYRRDGGTWKIVHHHTDVSPDIVGLLARLQKKAGALVSRVARSCDAAPRRSAPSTETVPTL